MEPVGVTTIVTALVFVLLGLEELPLSMNVERVARRLRRGARRRGVSLRDQAMRLTRETKAGAVVLAVMGVIAAGFAVAGPSVDSTLTSLRWILAAGLMLVAGALGALGPRLIERALVVVEARSATANSGLPDAEHSHGRGP